MRHLARTILIVILLGASARAQATLLVPSQFPTVQSAISAAVNGDTVLVDPGTYVENITPGGKAITIRGSQGAAVTTIDAGFAGPGLAVISGESPLDRHRGAPFHQRDRLPGRGHQQRHDPGRRRRLRLELVARHSRLHHRGQLGHARRGHRVLRFGLRAALPDPGEHCAAQGRGGDHPARRPAGPRELPDHRQHCGQRGRRHRGRGHDDGAGRRLPHRRQRPARSRRPSRASSRAAVSSCTAPRPSP